MYLGEVEGAGEGFWVRPLGLGLGLGLVDRIDPPLSSSY